MSAARGSPESSVVSLASSLLSDLDPDHAREQVWVRLGLRPQPGPQTDFLQSEADITIYGGAAGGGKSFGLLLAPIIVEQEPGSASLYHIDNLVDALPGFAVVGRPSTGSKILRAKPVSSAAEHGKVIIARGEWNRTFLQELEYFPDGAHDDQVDALSGAHASLVELLKALGSHEGEVVTYSDEVSISPV